MSSTVTLPDFYTPTEKIAIKCDEDMDRLCRRILVAIPYTTDRGILPQLQDLTVYWKSAGIEVVRFPNTGGFLDVVRCHSANTFLEDYPTRDFLIMIDSDIVPEDPGSVLQLAQWNVPIVGALCVVKNPEGELVANYGAETPWGVRSPKLQKDKIKIESGDLLPVKWVGAGLLCIQRNVLTQIENPFLLPESLRLEAAKTGTFSESEDQVFCRKAREAGFQVLVDPTITPTHMKLQPLVWANPSTSHTK